MESESHLEKAMDNRYLTMNVLVTPSMANFSGLMHGGELLKLLDQVAYACGTRYCGIGVITMSVESVVFRQPIPIGTLLTFLASVNYTGRTSCEIGIKVISENIKEQYVTHCVSCYFTMVAFQDGKTMPIPPLEPRTAIEKRRYQDALKRREQRSKK
ncbi:acyl-CoA thioesterase [Helicobacter fennelliae]|uniref:Cytosolic long-chain acyl-CoA thioester hydrolase family protein n=2 Tax=Helicobacter fennelliae TaxID=215 RepID=T1DUY0_9HELI|nr:acyl-CoA thioesterase [Helicobacter fennelliae]GAD18293.1 cytosolic long-chain acyl-CoA thioester hydrolase family protein [Helicobacter fennelliae MRY12-0050]SQB97829.1 acyl-CoA thioester hydrolase [Helicobacter fennelliae]STP06856.1 acyl-CoA thioester hydrolase [Helicobacter fennelliae]STQ83594.1 acyl-CoA thioester hydrolase [Helicobacter fennelliae]